MNDDPIHYINYREIKARSEFFRKKNDRVVYLFNKTGMKITSFEKQIHQLIIFNKNIKSIIYSNYRFGIQMKSIIVGNAILKGIEVHRSTFK